MTPLKIFEAWYISQPSDVKSRIASFVGSSLPHLSQDELMMYILDSKARFQAWLDEKPGTQFQHLGRIFLIREVTSLLVFRDAETAEDWETKEENNREMRETAKALGHHGLVATIDDMTSSAPERKRLWITATASWRQLRNSSLSDEALEAWFKQEGKRTLGFNE